MNARNDDGLTWRRSSKCVLPDGDCVEIAFHDGLVHVRDSKAGTVLIFDTAEWRAFIAGVKADEFG